MISRDASILILIGIVTVSALLGWLSTKYLGDDNPIEEAAEEVIKIETGRDVDLSPKSPEKKDYSP